MFLDDPTDIGNVAEAAVVLAAAKAGIPVYTPAGEHGRADMIFEIAGHGTGEIVMFTAICEVQDGRITRQAGVEAWRPGWATRVPGRATREPCRTGRARYPAPSLLRAHGGQT